MHKSRLAALVIDSQVDDIDEAAQFWGKALGCASVSCDEVWATQYVHLAMPKAEPRC